MALSERERHEAQRRLWHTANLQGLLLNSFRTPRLLETLATFHNTSLIEIELAAGTLGQPIEEGPLEITNPLRGLRTKDEILTHPIVSILEKDLEILRLAGAPTELRKKGQAAIDALRQAYREEHEPDPFSANQARKDWGEVLGVKNPTGHPSDILFAAAQKRDLVPNYNPVIRDLRRFQETPKDEIWQRLTEAKNENTVKHEELTTFLENGYADLEKTTIAPLISEVMAWYKATTSLPPSKLREITGFLREAHAYANQLPNLERDTLNRNLQTVACQIIGAKALDGLIREGKSQIQDLAQETAGLLAEVGLEKFGVSKSMVQLGNTLMALSMTVINKHEAYTEAKEHIRELVEKLTEKTYEKIIGEPWQQSRLSRHITEANHATQTNFREIQKHANQTYLHEMMKHLSPAGKRTAELAAQLCLVTSSSEGRIASEATEFQAVAGNLTDRAATKTNELALEYSDWLFAKNPELILDGWEDNPENPLDFLGEHLKETEHALPAAPELTQRSFRYREAWESKELLDYVLSNKEQAKTLLSDNLINWIEARERTKNHFNPYRPTVTFRRTGLKEILVEAEKDLGAPDPQTRQNDLTILQAIAANLSVDASNAYDVLQETPEDTQKRFLRAVAKLPDPQALETIAHPYLQTFENLSAEIEGVTAIEHIAKAKALDRINSHWKEKVEFLLQETNSGEPLFHRLVHAGAGLPLATSEKWGKTIASEKDPQGKPLLFTLIETTPGNLDAGESDTYRIKPNGITDANNTTVAAHLIRSNRLQNAQNWVFSPNDFEKKARDSGRTAWHELFHRPQTIVRLESNQVQELPWRAEALTQPDHTGQTPIRLARKLGLTHFIPEKILQQVVAIEDGLNNYEAITAALHKRAQGRPLSPKEESYFVGEALRPEIIDLANIDFGNEAKEAAILEMLATLEATENIDPSPERERESITH